MKFWLNSVSVWAVWVFKNMKSVLYFIIYPSVMYRASSNFDTCQCCGNCPCQSCTELRFSLCDMCVKTVVLVEISICCGSEPKTKSKRLLPVLLTIGVDYQVELDQVFTVEFTYVEFAIWSNMYGHYFFWEPY